MSDEYATGPDRCPFCQGGDLVLDEGERGFFVNCTKCGGAGPHHKNDQQAIILRNQRSI